MQNANTVKETNDRKYCRLLSGHENPNFIVITQLY